MGLLGSCLFSKPCTRSSTSARDNPHPSSSRAWVHHARERCPDPLRSRACSFTSQSTRLATSLARSRPRTIWNPSSAPVAGGARRTVGGVSADGGAGGRRGAARASTAEAMRRMGVMLRGRSDGADGLSFEGDASGWAAPPFGPPGKCCTTKGAAKISANEDLSDASFRRSALTNCPNSAEYIAGTGSGSWDTILYTNPRRLEDWNALRKAHISKSMHPRAHTSLFQL
mmetsp:Transcript_133750/g.303381  ORF Transcript_133750/g.303381 Transcript_133750/m.303381 type:complete len:228 (-) Transcript_133750:617-1300(-)